MNILFEILLYVVILLCFVILVTAAYIWLVSRKERRTHA